MKIFIAGSTGIPARYGGFEVFAENISSYLVKEFKVYIACSRWLYSRDERKQESGNCRCYYLPFKANGFQSVIYDFASLLLACIYSDFIIMLGSGSGFSVFLLRFLTGKTMAIHVDGIEWKRKKWNYLARKYLKSSTYLCYRFADFLLVDNDKLVDHIPLKYRKKIVRVNYGIEHLPTIPLSDKHQTKHYALTIARAEPENNLEMIINACLTIEDIDLIIISNWNSTKYGRFLKSKYSDCRNIKLIGPIYNDQRTLQQYRLGCKVYIHGHSAGGTNPSLVEAMAAGKTILAHDNLFNRSATNSLAYYFKNTAELKEHLQSIDKSDYINSGENLKIYAINNYSWQRESAKIAEIVKYGIVNNR